MNKRYFINRDKKQRGPLTFDELIKMRLTVRDQIWEEGTSDWKNILEFDILRPYIAPIPPTIPKDANRIKTVVAKEIRINFKILLLALVIGIISYPIIAYYNSGFKSLKLKKEYTALNKNYSGYEGGLIDTITDTQRKSYNYIQWNTKKENLEATIRSSLPPEDLVRREFYSITLIDYIESLDMNIKHSFGSDTIESSIVIFILAALILIAGRYFVNLIIKGIKWTRINSQVL